MSNRNNSVNTVCFNGVDAATGGYLRPTQDVGVLGKQIINYFLPEESVIKGNLARLHDSQAPHLGAIPSFDDLTEVHWAAVLFEGVDPAYSEAVAPLVASRNGRVLEWKRGETARQFVARYGPRLGDPDYNAVPFYLLLVIDPKDVPFSYQYQLCVDYAVGRVWYDSPVDLRRYATTAALAPLAAPPVDISLFGPDCDPATRLSAQELIIPVADALRDALQAERVAISSYIGEEATKPRLRELLHGVESRARLVFTATHGATYESDEQKSLQGALICQEWEPRTPLDDDAVFGADDVGAAVPMHNLMLFAFACFSAGTPHQDGFAFLDADIAPVLPADDFLASLPLALLRQGALAVVGHVDVAWSTSFLGESRPRLFSDTMKELVKGNRVGNAMRRFATTHAARSVELTELLERERAFMAMSDATPNRDSIVTSWLQKNDARAYMIVGDPAAQLCAR